MPLPKPALPGRAGQVADEFKKFILRGNVVDLAVGVIIGAAFGKIVESLVSDMFMPVVGLLTGGFNVSGQEVGYHDARIRWGSFVQSVINFVIIGFCMFMVVKTTARFMKKEEAKAGPTPTEVLLAEIRDLLAGQLPDDHPANARPLDGPVP